MKRALSSLGPFAFGAAAGGLLVGLGEALFRGVNPLYAALLYGALWSLVGAGAALLLSPLWRDRPVPKTQVRWGLLLATVPSTLVLMRFILLRDVLQEAPSAGLKALAGAAGSAVLVAAAILILARFAKRRFTVEAVSGSRWWLVPAGVLIAFAIRAQAGDDVLPDAPTAGSQLNGRGVILVLPDTLRADVLGAYGADNHRDQPPSPNFDALAERGLLFQDLSAQASWTRPAVATIHTSRHASGHDTMSKAAVLPAELPTLATVLKEGGVKTGAVVTNYNLEDGYGFNRGFDEFAYLPPARYLGAPPRANRLAAYNVYRLLREKLLRGSREARHFYREANVVNAVGMQMLDRIGDGDFFLWLHTMEPHDPYFADDGRSWAKVSDPHPPASWANDMRSAYRDDVRRFDDGLGQLLEALSARGLSDRVTLVVVSDHGEEFADHGGFYHGVTLYEEQLHVPLLLAGPGIAPGVDTSLARQIDVAPTIAALFGIPAPEGWEGRDLLGDSEPPTASLAEENHEGNVLASIRKAGHKLIRANADNPRGLQTEEVYDLAADPDEASNVAATQTEVVTALREELLKMKIAARVGGATAGEKELDADAAAELRALGYVQ